MTGGVLGGGVIFVVAALLWAAVLVPAWVRRREFKAAERNALRLQRTLRVLAETAEVPTEVRVEATAREALAQEKILRTAQRQQEAERQAKLAEARAAQVRAQMKAQQMKRAQAAMVRAAKLRRPWVRRTRSLAALVAFVSLGAALVGAGFAVAGQGVALLLGSSFAFAAAAGGLVLMAPGRVKLMEIPAEAAADTVVPAVAPVAEPVSIAAEPVDTAASAAAHAAAQAQAAARIERARALARARAGSGSGSGSVSAGAAAGVSASAAASASRPNQPDSILLDAEGSEFAGADGISIDVIEAAVAVVHDPEAERRARAQEAIDRSARAVAQAAAPSSAHEESLSPLAERLRQMGVVGDTTQGMPDLDAALRRHRAAS